MSLWSNVLGTVSVNLFLDSTVFNEYVLKTVLSHLPDIKGSEGGIDIFINTPSNGNSSCSHDEWEVYAGYSTYNILNMNRFSTGNPTDFPYFKDISTKSTFILTLHGNLRDVDFDDCLKQVNKWLNRLAKRVSVSDINIMITGDYVKENTCERKTTVIQQNEKNNYTNMEENYSWYLNRNKNAMKKVKQTIECETNPNLINWTEFLFTDIFDNCRYPKKLAEKYFGKEEVEEMVKLEKERNKNEE